MRGAERDVRAPAGPGDLALERYLARVAAALHALPPTEREEILLETRSHVVEQTGRSPARGVEDVLAELGEPQAYAHQFLAEQPPEERDARDAREARVGAPAGAPDLPAGTSGHARRGSTTLFALAQLTTRGARAMPWITLAGVVYVLIAVVLLFVVAELIDPAGTGIFVRRLAGGKLSISVLVSSEAARGFDVLGDALVPIGLVLAAILHFAMRALLLFVVRGDDRQAAPAFAPAPVLEPPHALGRSVTLRGLLMLGAGGWRRVPLLVLVMTGYGIAGWGVLLVVSELIDPAGTGFMVRRLSSDQWQVGFMMSGTPRPGEDVLGVWFAPLVLLIIAVIHLGVRALLLHLIRRDARRA
ncbi:MAG TPA: hypothetical protein VEZ47_02695 [Gemmatirosa sp.]|nr:hypothetical protein [Gemmatirosa sp.]